MYYSLIITRICIWGYGSLHFQGAGCRMEEISWTDCVRNEEVLLRVKEERNILHEIRKRKENWIGHILRRNCLIQLVIEGKIKGGIGVTGRRGRRSRKLLDDLKERRAYSLLKEEALDRTVWRAGFGRGFGPVVKQTTKWMMNMSVRTKLRPEFLHTLSNDPDRTHSSGAVFSLSSGYNVPYTKNCCPPLDPLCHSAPYICVPTITICTPRP